MSRLCLLLLGVVLLASGAAGQGEEGTEKPEEEFQCDFPNPDWCEAAKIRWEQQRYAETRDNYTRYVFGMFDSGKYDNRTRPGFRRGIPDSVKVRLYVETLGPASAAEMSFFQDLYLTQIWTDERLDGVEALGLPETQVPMYPDIVYSLWTPDTYFRNGIDTEIVETHANKIGLIVKISTRGEIMVTKRLRVKANCPMHLQYFPFDRQLCELEIGSFSYDNEDIIFKWASQSLHFKEDLMVPQFDFLKHNIVVREFQIPTMPSKQTILVVQYLLHRKVALYLGQIFLPAMLIVIVSWVTFYINPAAVPARASVGITCVLTMMTLTTSCIGSLPTNLMYTPVDIYLGACFMFVFSALLEFAVVNFSETAIKTRAEKARREAENVGEKNGQAAWGGPVPACDPEVAAVTEGGAAKSCGVSSLWPIKPIKIDYVSRYAYPFAFTVFNLVYWTLCLILSSSFNEQIASNVEIEALTN